MIIRQFRFLKITVTIGATIMFLMFVAQLFFSPYYNYGAESVGLYSVLRIAHGLFHVSDFYQVPSHLSAYGGHFYYIVGLPLRWLGVTDPYWINFFSKGFILDVSFVLFYVLWRMRPKDGQRDLTYFLFLMLFIMSIFPAAFIGFKPDFMAILFELLGVTCFISILDKEKRYKGIFLSSLFFALAIMTKFNHLGAFAGLGLYCLIEKRWKDGWSLLFFTIAMTALFGYGCKLIYPQTYWQQILGMANYGLFGISKWGELFEKLLWNMIFTPAIWHLLVFYGYQQESKNKKSKVLLCSGLITFAIGCLSQIKIGAWYNYFYGYFILTFPLAMTGIKHLFDFIPESPQANKMQNLLVWFCLVTSVLFYTNGAFLVFRALYNDFGQYPVAEVKKYLNEHYPKATIYSPEASMTVHFYKDTLLGPWDENNYTQSKILKDKEDEFLQMFRDVNFDIAIVPGSGCQDWKPSGKLISKISHLVKLEKKMKKICIYSGEKTNF